MSGRNSIVVIAVLCAFVLCAVAAATASAEGRAYLCTKSAEAKTFKDEHCLTGGEGANRGHVLVHDTNGKGEVIRTPITGTNAKTASGTTAAQVASLSATLAGVATEVQCTSVSASGELINTLVFASVYGTIQYTGCTVTKPAGKGCKVNGGAVTTAKLSTSTAVEGSNKVKIEPFAGTELASVTIEGCSVIGLNQTFPVTGSVVVGVTGATASTTHAGVTSQKTLNFGGKVAGIEGTITFSRSGGDPIVLT